MDALDFVGILCIEFFITRDGRLLVNELAPRPHNSGHLTFDACRTSQFEQQCARSAACRSARPDLLQPRRQWPTCWATYGKTGSPTGGRAGHAGRQAPPVR